MRSIVLHTLVGAFFFGVLLIVSGLFMLNPDRASSGLRFQGSDLSKTDAKRFNEDIVGLFSGVRIGQGTHNASYVPKTELGAQMKSLLGEADSAEREWLQTAKDIDVANLLTPYNLGDPARRKEALTKVNTLAAGMKTYYQRRKDVSQRLVDLVKSVLGEKASTGLVLPLEEQAKMEAANTLVLHSAYKYIRFATAKKAEVASGSLTFESDADVDEHNKIVTELQGRAEAVDKLEAEIKDRRQKEVETLLPQIAGA